MLSKYFSIVGYSKSGKTFSIEKIISYLTQKGYKVGVCKYIHHPGFGIDIPDKDTTKYYENGAKIISYVAPDASGIIYIEKDNINMTLRNIETKVDYLILEGFRDLVGVPNI
ncbi:MAG: molybdopterin-guanine dinucleotide biosynthesis protein B, partial [Candidatus Hodarchaeota archaeon]